MPRNDVTQAVRELTPAVAGCFEIPGRLESVERHGSGHIHETFRAQFRDGDQRRGYIFQRINTRVFGDPVGLMSNIDRVTRHLRQKLAGQREIERHCLALVSAAGGGTFHVDSDGGYWRVFHLIRDSHSVDEAGPDRARRAARAFGEFVALLGDLGPPQLTVTIPGFHDLAGRITGLEEILSRDSVGRVASATRDADAVARGYEAVKRALPDLDSLPQRITHNDCKLNNVLFDRASGKPLCVIDLDTVMSGNLMSDFGDLVRTAAATAAEDERDLTRVDFDLERFRPLIRGYLEGLRSVGNPVSEAERWSLGAAGAVMALENAARFLADHLEGDVYFRISRKGHNLDRARNQLRLMARMLDGLAETRVQVEEAWSEVESTTGSDGRPR